MTKQSEIIAAEARFPLASLVLSPMNPRQHVPEAEVAELAESIWTAGLIQNLSGLDDGKGGAEIVAGGRRLRALQYLAQQHPDLAETRPDLANPLVNLAPDRATAEAWAHTENIARKALEPVDEIRAYGKMETGGAQVSTIARAFAVTEKHVYRRLALAHLPEPVLDALAAGEISLGIAACFTISDDEAHSLEVLDRVRGNSWMSEYQVKQALKPDVVKATDRRAVFVGLDAYKEAGGQIGGDLFADETFLDDPALLDELFRSKLEADAEAIRAAEGWKWAEISTDSYVSSYDLEQQKFAKLSPVPGEFTEEQAARWDQLQETDQEPDEELDDESAAELEALEAILDGGFTDDQKAHAGLIAVVRQGGAVEFTKGLVQPSDKAAAVEAGVLETSTSGKAETQKSPISAKLADDLSRVACGARQHAALSHPELILSLLAFQLSSAARWTKAIGLTQNEVPNFPTTEAEGYELDERLTTPSEFVGNGWNNGTASDFREFRKKGKEFIEGELIRHLAALLQGSKKDMNDLIDREVKTDIRAVWTPTAENFFKRVGGPYLNDLWCELLDLKADDAKAQAFAKLKKGEKAEELEKLFSDPEARKAQGVTKKQAAKIAKWLPEGMK